MTTTRKAMRAMFSLVAADATWFVFRNPESAIASGRSATGGA